VPFLAALLLSGQPIVAKPHATWPVVRPLHAIASYPPGRVGDTPFLALISDTGNVPRYRFECHNGDYDSVIGFTYSGSFHCALFAIDGSRLMSDNLLADDSSYEGSADWTNRGRLLARQLRGPCASWPEYGLVRHFHLRGMTVTMRFTDIGWERTSEQSDERLGRFTFVLSIEPDPRATAPQSARVRVPRPPRECGF
jgi:hypothetical protein